MEKLTKILLLRRTSTADKLHCGPTEEWHFLIVEKLTKHFSVSTKVSKLTLKIR